MGSYNPYNIGKQSEQMIKKANIVTIENLIDINKKIPINKKNIKDAELINVISKYFQEKLQNNKILMEDMIFLLANSRGQVVEVISSKEVPTFLKKNNNEYLDFRTETIGVNSIGLAVDNKVFTYVQGKEHSLDLLKEYMSISVPIILNDGLFSIVISVLVSITSNPNKKIADLLKLLLESFYIESKLLTKIQKDNSVSKLTKGLYSSINTIEVLSEAIKYVRYIYPKDELELWLTHDYEIQDVKINLLTKVHDNENVISKSFIEGKMYIDQQLGQLVAPIRGKQGIYGVLKIYSEDFYDSLKSHFIEDITEIMGSAFEKANLYEQSINSVKKFQLINDLTKVLNSSLKEEAILEGTIKELNRVYKTEYISFFNLGDKENELQVVASNYEEKYKSLSINDTYVGLAFNRKEPIIIADSNKGYGIQDGLNKNSYYNSLIAVPIFVEGEIINVLSIGSMRTNRFSYDDLKTIELCSQHLGLALTNSHLYRKIKRLANTDYLTNLYNRSYLDKKIIKLQNVEKNGSLLLFDIDNFKDINDIHGHQTGDQVLVQVANIFKTSIREEDIAARWGGEELAIYLHKANVDISKKIGERIIKRVESETTPKITISCGVATWKGEENNIDYLDLVHKADKALYVAKNNGKNQLRVYK